jgi:hypothetical protein
MPADAHVNIIVTADFKGANAVKAEIQGIGKAMSDSIKLDESHLKAQLKGIVQDFKQLGQTITSQKLLFDDKGVKGFQFRVKNITDEAADARVKLEELVAQMHALGESASIKESVSKVQTKAGEQTYTTFAIEVQRANEKAKKSTNDATRSMLGRINDFVGAAVSGFQVAASAAQPYIAAVLAIGRAYVSILRFILNVTKAIAAIPIQIIKTAASAVQTLARNILQIPINVIKSLATGFKNLAASILQIPGNMLGNLSRSLGQIGTIIAGLVGYSGLRAVGRQFASMLKDFGPVESIGIQFENFTAKARAGVSGFSDSAGELIGKMQGVTGGALNMTTMMEKANLAFMLIGDSVGKHLPQLLAIAQAAALAMGKDIEDLFYSLAQGIGRLSVRWIDNLGISIHTTEEYKRYAAEVGKSASALTLAEKQQAILNATLREGAEILATVGDVSLMLSTQVNALKSTFENTRDALTSTFAPIFTVIFAEMNKFFTESGRKAQEWAVGFVDAFAQLPSAAQREMDKLSEIFGNALSPNDVDRIVQPIRDGHEQMGYEAGRWAINALTWGANIGSQLVIGIIRGFTAIIMTAINLISSVLSNWFSANSPPRVAPHIDDWGAAMMGEWVKGMLSYPVSENIEKIKDELAEVLGGGVQDSLYQYGVDSIAEWAKGLSIIDMEFLIKSVDSALSKLKALNDELTKSYKKQSTELFKMQVLGKDPSAVRAALTRAKTTKKAVDANQKEIDLLETRKGLLQDQLELMRMLLQVVEKASAGSGGGGGGGAGGGGALADLEETLEGLGQLGGGGLAEKLSGIRDTLSNIFKEPLKNIKEAFDQAKVDIGKSWDALVVQFQASKPELYAFFDDIVSKAKTAWTQITDFIKGMFSGFTGMNLGQQIPDEVLAQIPQDKLKDVMPSGEFFAGMDFAEDIKRVLGKAGEEIGKALDFIKENKDEWITSFKELFIGIAFAIGLVDEGPEWANKIKGFLETIGKGLDYIKENKDEWIAKAQELFDAIKLGAGAFLEDITPIVKDTVTQLGNLADAFVDLSGVAEDAPGMADRFITFGKLLAIAGRVLIFPVKLIVELATNLVKAIDNILDAFERLGRLDVGGAFKSVVGLRGNIDDMWKTLRWAVPTTWVASAGAATGEAVASVIKKGAENIKSRPKTTVDWVAVGEDIVGGTAQGIDNSVGTLTTAASSAMQAGIEAAEARLGSRSPSKVFDAIGKDTIAGYILGLISQTAAIIATISAIMSAVVAAANSYVAGMMLSGLNLAKGLAAGLNAGTPWIIEAARAAARAAKKAVDDELGNNSPSKEGEWSGKMLALGVAGGISGAAHYPVDAASAMARGVLGALGGSSGGARSSQVNFNGPIVENMVVPNMAVGRQMSLQIAQDISDKIQVRRSPA